ncbi:MAG: hypothetical protein M1831_001643 [Alyxoria varia]|nr:MAG: hypothetical protein M1831_001643 [Alyxoria varia]
MATQPDVPGIPVFYDYQQQGIRLLELPEELQDQLLGPNSPSLTIKAAPDEHDANRASKGSHVVLCTRDQTLQLRQVQSSNTLLLLRPQNIPMEKGRATSQGVSAFATCNGTLEAQQPAQSDKAGKQSAMELMKEILPLCNRISNINRSDPVSVSKDTVFSRIPFSHQELADAWTELVCFELHSQSFRPSLSLLASFWTDLVQSAVADGIDLSSPFTFDELWETVQEMQYPQSLLTSLIAKLSTKAELPLQFLTLDPEKTTLWLADLMSQAEGFSDSQQSIAALLEKMKALVPEPWRPLCSRERFTILQDRQDLASSATLGATQDSATSAGTLENKRKATGRDWHEKFKKTRK